MNNAAMSIRCVGLFSILSQCVAMAGKDRCPGVGETETGFGEGPYPSPHMESVAELNPETRALDFPARTRSLPHSGHLGRKSV